MEAIDALPPFPTAKWTLGAQNASEAVDELTPYPTAAAGTPGGVGPAVESGPKTAVGGRWSREAPLGMPLRAVTPRGIEIPR